MQLRGISHHNSGGNSVTFCSVNQFPYQPNYNILHFLLLFPKVNINFAHETLINTPIRNITIIVILLNNQISKTNL